VNNEFTSRAVPSTSGAVPSAVVPSVKVTVPPLGTSDADEGALTWAVNVTG
jgi:hypothetical protein